MIGMIARLLWDRILRRFFYYQAASIALRGLLARPYDTTQDQDIDAAYNYADAFITAGDIRFIKLQRRKNGKK